MSASVQQQLAELRGRLLESQAPFKRRDIVPTGLDSFDRLLPEGGIPSAALVEWIESSCGTATTSLALRCSAELLRSPGTLAVVDPTNEFYPVSIRSLQIDPRRVLVVRPNAVADLSSRTPSNSEEAAAESVGKTGLVATDRQQRSNVLWTIEQLARCAGVRVLLTWIDRLSATAQRRLQLAVERSGVTVHLIRPARAAQQTSWADLRFQVRALDDVSVPGDTKLAVRLVRSKNSVQSSGQTELVCHYESGVVSEV